MFGVLGTVGASRPGSPYAFAYGPSPPASAAIAALPAANDAASAGRYRNPVQAAMALAEADARQSSIELLWLGRRRRDVLAGVLDQLQEERTKAVARTRRSSSARASGAAAEAAPMCAQPPRGGSFCAEAEAVLSHPL